jgi:hypothetical protein
MDSMDTDLEHSRIVDELRRIRSYGAHWALTIIGVLMVFAAITLIGGLLGDDVEERTRLAIVAAVLSFGTLCIVYGGLLGICIRTSRLDTTNDHVEIMEDHANAHHSKHLIRKDAATICKGQAQRWRLLGRLVVFLAIFIALAFWQRGFPEGAYMSVLLIGLVVGLALYIVGEAWRFVGAIHST